MRRCALHGLVLAAAGFALCGGAQAGSTSWDSYAVKFVCGGVASAAGENTVEGKYRTVVNIHNPHYLATPGPLPVPLILLKKIVLAEPQGQPQLPPSCFLQENLNADEALSVTCTNIRAQLALSGLPSPPLIDGYVVLLVPPDQNPPGDPNPPEIDVTAVYTGRSRIGGADILRNGVGTLDVETVRPTSLRGDPAPIDFCD